MLLRDMIRGLQASSMEQHLMTGRELAEKLYRPIDGYLLSGSLHFVTQHKAMISTLHKPLYKKWAQKRRDRWLQSFTASIDLLIDIK